ncbi:phosphotransferase family protein [Nonomuraea endophytica]|uniref:phosphotransferase family protein n=1 Tax=Nonomuraea endophytica TaxID=714136 RepID=UPI0035E41295
MWSCGAFQRQEHLGHGTFGGGSSQDQLFFSRAGQSGRERGVPIPARGCGCPGRPISRPLGTSCSRDSRGSWRKDYARRGQSSASLCWSKAEIPEPRPSAPIELGRELRRLHALPIPSPLELPCVEPLARVADRIAGAVGLPDHDQQRLRDIAAEMDRGLAHARVDLSTGPVHGDGHVDNLVRGSDGRLRWVDLENAPSGSRNGILC